MDEIVYLCGTIIPPHTMEEKKLFLLDAYALIYRAYYGLIRAPRVNSAGMNTSAIFGFCNTLEEVLRKENPGYIAVCFDPVGGETFRHEQFAEYKAGRDKQPEDITIAVPYIKEILAAFNIRAIEMAGYEADDVIGTLSVKAQHEGFTTYMMTPDKDYGQLVTDKVLMYRPSLRGNGFEIRGPKEVCERYGLQAPIQMIDLLALEGDTSDNIPGCPGVGPKTAADLIGRFGSVENLLAHTSELKGALKQKIENNAAQIELSKSLATICTSVPIEIDLESLRRREPNLEALLEIFRKLEFNSLINRYTQQASASSPAAPRQETPREAEGALSLFDFADAQENEPVLKEEFASRQILTDAVRITEFINQAIQAGEVGLGVAAFGPEAMTATVTGISLSYGQEENQTAYLPLPAEQSARAELMNLLEPLFSSDTVTIVSPDIKRDMIVLLRLGLTFQGAKYFDVGVAHYIVNPEGKHDIRYLANTVLHAAIPGGELSGKDAAAADTAENAARFGAVASYSLRLKPLLIKQVEELGLVKLMDEVEMPLVAVLAAMEWEGVRIDSGELASLARKLDERLNQLQAKAFEIAGTPFNVSSPSQVGTILFEKLAIDPKAKKTKSGAWSTAEDVLEKYAADVPLVGLILDIRALKKLLTTYVEALPKLVNPHTGKIHTTFNQTVTATGRISSTNPNLQNIPVRTADGREIRRAFIADPGCLILSADYSQIELRLMADFSADPSMVEAFLEGEDIHRATAAKIYHLDPKEVTDTQRRNAKTANFGIIYGISAFGLSERLGIPRSEAKELINGYLATYPEVSRYMNNAIEQARKDGYVSTILGRRRYLPDINSRSNAVRGYAERNAINAPLQGSAADIIKIAMVRIDAEIRRRGLRSRMIMQVHDELIFNVFPEEAPQLQQLVTELMEKAYSGRVPMEVSSGLASNWLDAH